MNTELLHRLITTTTIALRKGDVVTTEKRAGVRVTTLDGMPTENDVPGDLKKIDLHFILVGVDITRAAACKQEFIRLLAEYPEPERLAGGPSYIELGGVLGDQGLALQFMALGAALDLWEVITPETLGITGDEADTAAGSGFVMISGYKPGTS